MRLAAEEGLPVGFHGSTPGALEAMAARARTEFPGIRIAYLHSPPFLPATPAEDAAHRGRVPAVMLGVGAVFDQHSGRVPACPRALSALGLEWAYRSLREPRRILWRNLRSTMLLAVRAAGQFLAGGRNGACA